jgi:hypothetical protein
MGVVWGGVVYELEQCAALLAGEDSGPAMVHPRERRLSSLSLSFACTYLNAIIVIINNLILYMLDVNEVGGWWCRRFSSSSSASDSGSSGGTCSPSSRSRTR